MTSAEDWLVGSLVRGDLPPLRNDEAHVWRIDLAEDADYPWRSVLTASELCRANQFLRDEDRQRFAAGRGLLRRLLGHYLDEEPKRVALIWGGGSKPHLPGDPRFRFNVSHAGRLVLVALIRNHEVGVDVEAKRKISDWETIAKRFFCRSEIAALQAADASARRGLFFRIWTRKEAVLKALGKGLYGDLDQVDVLTHEPFAMVGTTTRWWLADLPLATPYRAALALPRAPERILRWNASQFTRE